MIDSLGRAVAGVDPGMLFWEVVINSALAAVLGVLISYTYKFINRSNTHSGSFFQVIVCMAVVVCFVMMIIGSNIARAFSLVGALSIIRFRTAVKDAKDTMYIFYAMMVGMACGVGYRSMAVYATIFMGLLLLFLNRTGISGGDQESKKLKIQFDENNETRKTIESILAKYCIRYKMNALSSIKQGTLLEALYDIELIKNSQSEEFLKKLMQANGNQKVSLFDFS